MANILQVTSPSVNTDNRTISDSQKAADQESNQRIHNLVDPSRVVRADGQEEGKAGDATTGNKYNVIDYESNYGAFIKKLGEGLKLPRLLEQLFSRETAGLLFGEHAEVGELVEQLLSSVRVSSPEELLELMQGQQFSSAKFSGSFFDALRNMLQQSPADGPNESFAAFLKALNDFSSGSHFLHQMRTLTNDIESLLFRQYKDEFEQIVNEMDWEAADGDTAANTGVLNNRLIPFLSGYISRTHDYGAVRNAMMLLVFHAVRYENGSLDRLLQLFDRLMEGGRYAHFFKDNPRQELEQILDSIRQPKDGGFSDAFSALLAKGANGEAGLEHVQQFYQVLNGLLLNESVYLPLLHFLVPFQYQGKNVMSEIWADPDAERESEEEGRKIKMLFKFHIESLGQFEMLLTYRDRIVDLHLCVSPLLSDRYDAIKEQVAGIMKKNGLEINRFFVREETNGMRIEDVFPEIREKERTINVRI